MVNKTLPHNLIVRITLTVIIGTTFIPFEAKASTLTRAGRTTTTIPNTLLNGKGAPASSLGINGDFYIDISTFNIYGPKSSGKWLTPTSLKAPVVPAIKVVAGKGNITSSPTGPKGDAGAQGIAGAQGAQGIQGAKGENGKDGAQGLPGLPGGPGVNGEVGAPGPAGAPGSSGATGPMGPVGATGPVGPSDVVAINISGSGGTIWTVSSSVAGAFPSGAFGNLQANKSYFFTIKITGALSGNLSSNSGSGIELGSTDSNTVVKYESSYAFGRNSTPGFNLSYQLTFTLTGTIKTSTSANLTITFIDGSGWTGSNPLALTGTAFIQQVGSVS